MKFLTTAVLAILLVQLAASGGLRRRRETTQNFKVMPQKILTGLSSTGTTYLKKLYLGKYNALKDQKNVTLAEKEKCVAIANKIKEELTAKNKAKLENICVPCIKEKCLAFSRECATAKLPTSEPTCDQIKEAAGLSDDEKKKKIAQLCSYYVRGCDPNREKFLSDDCKAEVKTKCTAKGESCVPSGFCGTPVVGYTCPLVEKGIDELEENVLDPAGDFLTGFGESFVDAFKTDVVEFFDDTIGDFVTGDFVDFFTDDLLDNDFTNFFTNDVANVFDDIISFDFDLGDALGELGDLFNDLGDVFDDIFSGFDFGDIFSGFDFDFDFDFDFGDLNPFKRRRRSAASSPTCAQIENEATRKEGCLLYKNQCDCEMETIQFDVNEACPTYVAEKEKYSTIYKDNAALFAIKPSKLKVTFTSAKIDANNKIRDKVYMGYFEFTVAGTPYSLSHEMGVSSTTFKETLPEILKAAIQMAL